MKYVYIHMQINFKYALLLVVVVLLPLLSMGQASVSRQVPNLPKYDQKKLNFGFYVGANQMLMGVKTKPGFEDKMYYPEQVQDLLVDSAQLNQIYGSPSLGIALGIVSSYRFGKYFTVRFVPGLQFGERSIEYKILQFHGVDTLRSSISKRIPSTYVDFPLHIRYDGARIHNFRPYFFGGGTVKLDLASNAKRENSANDVLVKLKGMDAALEVGAGFDVFTNWFKFSVQLKMSYGLVDVMVHENTIYSDGIESLHSKLFQVVMTFE